MGSVHTFNPEYQTFFQMDVRLLHTINPEYQTFFQMDVCATTYNYQPRISNLFQMDVCALCVRYYMTTQTDRQTDDKNVENVGTLKDFFVDLLIT